MPSRQAQPADHAAFLGLPVPRPAGVSGDRGPTARHATGAGVAGSRARAAMPRWREPRPAGRALSRREFSGDRRITIADRRGHRPRGQLRTGERHVPRRKHRGRRPWAGPVRLHCPSQRLLQARLPGAREAADRLSRPAGAAGRRLCRIPNVSGLARPRHDPAAHRVRHAPGDRARAAHRDGANGF